MLDMVYFIVHSRDQAGFDDVLISKAVNPVESRRYGRSETMVTQKSGHTQWQVKAQSGPDGCSAYETRASRSNLFNRWEQPKYNI